MWCWTIVIEFLGKAIAKQMRHLEQGISKR